MLEFPDSSMKIRHSEDPLYAHKIQGIKFGVDALKVYLLTNPKMQKNPALKEIRSKFLNPPRLLTSFVALAEESGVCVWEIRAVTCLNLCSFSV